jgi:NTE family protein
VGDLSDEAFLKSTLILRYELFDKNYISFITNAARAEKDLINQGSIFENTKLGYAVGYSIESFLGPLEMKYTWSPDTKLDYWFFNIGFWF